MKIATRLLEQGLVVGIAGRLLEAVGGFGATICSAGEGSGSGFELVLPYIQFTFGNFLYAGRRPLGKEVTEVVLLPASLGAVKLRVRDGLQLVCNFHKVLDG